jgi:hypothetical protein
VSPCDAREGELFVVVQKKSSSVVAASFFPLARPHRARPPVRRGARALASCVLTNVLLPPPRSTRLFGRNLKFPVGLLIPVALLLYIALTVALAPVFALVFALVYPGYITAEVKMQSAWRYAYVWAGWTDTLNAMLQNLAQYWYTCTLGARETLRTIRRKAWPYRYEIHPLNVTLAFLTLPLGGAVLGAVCAAVLAVKLPLMIFRAYSNHVRGVGNWCRGPILTVAWAVLLPLLPVGAALLIPAAVGYAFYESYHAALMVLEHRGNLLPPLVHLGQKAWRIHRESTR